MIHPLSCRYILALQQHLFGYCGVLMLLLIPILILILILTLSK